MIRLLRILVLLLLPLALTSQNYPVHITTQLVAPFSGYLPDYASAGEEKLKLLLLFNDFSKPHYNVKLKISIQGQGITIQSKNWFFDVPHTLQPGVPFELSGSGLYNLLNTQNLDFSGITRAQYEQKKVLPEGFYTICVTAYDYNNPTPIQVSNNACAQAWMILSDPPFLNLPVCSSTVAITNPQQQTFSFTQMNMGSPNSAANTQFVFELWEIRPQGAAANNIVQTVPPVYSYTTNLTTINYGITEPPLLPGMQYAWRVKAQDITGRDYFKNNGCSQVCTFTYGDPYSQTAINLNLQAQAVSQRQIKVWWDSLANFSSYKLEYRKAGSSGTWFPAVTPNCRLRVLDLEPQTTYEFHVQGISNEFTSAFSNPVNATTQAPPDYQCGELPAFPTNTNFQPLQQANANMFWQVGQFEMRVTALQNTMSAAGVYSGYGKIKMPFMGYVNCSFSNITVSTDQVVVQGKVNALTEGIDQWVNNNSTGTIQDGNAEPEVHTNIPLDPGDIHVNTNSGTVEVGGSTYTYTPSGTTIEDSEGNLFIVTADGQVIQAGTLGQGQGAVPDSKNFISTNKGTVAFNASAKELYGTDKFRYPALINYYLTVRNLSTNERQPVDWKSVMAQKYDVIDLSYQLSGDLKPDSILFITGTGTVYKPQGSGTNRQLYIIGGKHGDVQELFACYKFSRDSFVNIAKINLVSYRQEENKVTLIPFGSGISIDKVALQKQLNEIYKQSVASWQVDVAPAISISDTAWDKDGNGRLNAGGNLFSRYSGELRAINKYVRSQSYYKSDQFYLVVTDKPADSLEAGLLGEMPRGRNIGYLFTSAPTATLVAHELGHGAFALEHSFDGNASLPKGTSACLMDYNNGTELYKGKYWDYVHNPVTVIGGLEGDEDGSEFSVSTDVKLLLNLMNRIKYSCQANSTMQLPSGTTVYTVVTDFYLGGIHFDFMRIYIPKPIIGANYIAAHNNLLRGVARVRLPFWKRDTLVPVISVDGKIFINVPNNRLLVLKEYLEGNIDGRNLLIFANGYRPNTPNPIENPKMPDEVNLTDVNGYWKGIDAMFINRIGTRNLVYADGHQTVATSNHLSETSFMTNYAEWGCTAIPLQFALNPAATVLGAACAAYYHNDKLFKLHTTPNNEGFQTRRNSGKLAGLDLIAKINNGTIKFDPAKDTIDIVSHSMGHAYALGIIDALSTSSIKFKFGRFYCLAPENGCSTNAKFNFDLFEEVWQYGSNERKDLVWEQDGIAPQCPIPGIENTNSKSKTKFGRIFIPEKVNPKRYLESHMIVYYFWLFSEVKKGMNGYVKER